MRARKQVRTITATLAISVLLLSACNGASDPDGNNDDAGAGADVVSAEAGAADVAEDAPADDAETEEEEDDSSDVEAGSANGMDPAAMTDSECLHVGNALTGIISRGLVGSFDVDLATFRTFAMGAPEQARAEITTALDAYEASYRLTDDAGIDLSDAASIQAGQDTVTAANELVETPEVEAALQTTENFFFEACPQFR